MRALERDGRQPVGDDGEATATGMEAAGEMEAKIIARAEATSAAEELRPALRRFETSAAWLAVVFCVVMALVGAGAARASLGVGEASRVNFFLALVTLLGVQTLVLVIWMLLVMARPSAMGSMSLGGFVRWVVDAIMRRASRSPVQVAALEGAMVAHGSPKVAKWTLSSLSHAGWLSFNVGCLAALLVLLSARHYTFVWETTILSERAYRPMVEALSAVPARVGFNVPSEAQVRASQWTGTANGDEEGDVESLAAEGARQAWAGLLVGSIVIYGALPRVVLLVLCVWRMRAARRGYRLDLNRAGFALLAARLVPQRASLGVVDPDDGEAASSAEKGAQRPAAVRPIGPPAIVGIEMDAPRGWPPRLEGATLHDLGMLNDRPDRQRAIHELHTAAQEPAALVIACPLPATPDRGLGSIIAQLRAAVRRPAVVLLTGGHALRERTDAAAMGRRIEDWRSLAVDAGVQPERILELDLDHATHASLARLSALVTESGGAPEPRAAGHISAGRGVERAFAIIAAHAGAWRGAPDHRAQAKLHREILEVYGSESGAWSSLVGKGTVREIGVDTARALRSNADRAVRLLPPNLRLRPKWAIAGASAGAIGCIAAAMLAAPAAIGALPLWAIVGSAIAAAAGAALPRGSGDESGAEHDAASTTDAVRAAALSTLLLELQGRDEQSISHVLDRTLSDPHVDAPDSLEDRSDVSAWLDVVRHRFDLALAEEARS